MVRRHGNAPARLGAVEGGTAGCAHPRWPACAVVELCRSQGPGASKRSGSARACGQDPARARYRAAVDRRARLRGYAGAAENDSTAVLLQMDVMRLYASARNPYGQFAVSMLPCSMIF